MYEEIAKLCYKVNKAYCESLGDNSYSSWENAPDWQKDTLIKGVKFHFNTSNANPADSHNSWLKEKEATGWKYGKVKDVEKKEHPCFVPYEELPKEQKAKDYIFKAICDYFKDKGKQREYWWDY